MKYWTPLLLSSVLIGLSGSAHAQLRHQQHPQGYVEAGVGAGYIHTDCKAMRECKKFNAGYRLLGGFALAEGLYAEAGYQNFGRVKSRSTDKKFEMQAKAFTLGAAYRIPLGESFNAHLRGGVARVEMDDHVTSGLKVTSAKQTRFAPYAGVGVSLDFTKDVSVGVNADISRGHLDDKKYTLGAFNVSLRRSF